MHVLVTGAGGFLGRALVERLLHLDELNGARVEALTLLDTALPPSPDARVRRIEGSLLDPDVLSRIRAEKVDCLFHLAAVPGGAAEADESLGWAVNFDGTRHLIEQIAAGANVPRVIYCSSIAVFGVPLPALIDDETLPLPTMSYGAQKLMIETWLNDMSRRGRVDARALRLPGIIARPRQPSGLISAFMSDVFHAALNGETFVLPVSEQATVWVMSVQRCVDNLLLAAHLPVARLTGRRAWTLPALHLSVRDLVDGLATVLGPEVRGRIHHAPVPSIEAQFGSQPPLRTPLADALGFQHDGDGVALCRRVVTHLTGGVAAISA